MNSRNLALFAAVAVLFLITGFYQSWNLSLSILNMAIVSAIMAMGVNIQWGYAGLFNVGIMGFAALGGLAVVLTSSQPVDGAWKAGGPGIVLGLLLGVATVGLAVALYKRMERGLLRTATLVAVLVGGFFLYRWVFDPAAMAVEANSPEAFGNIGGFFLHCGSIGFVSQAIGVKKFPQGCSAYGKVHALR